MISDGEQARGACWGGSRPLLRPHLAPRAASRSRGHHLWIGHDRGIAPSGLSHESGDALTAQLTSTDTKGVNSARDSTTDADRHRSAHADVYDRTGAAR